MNAIRILTSRELVEEFGAEGQFYILDIYQSLELVSNLEGRMNRLCYNIQHNVKQSEEKDIGYQPMSNDNVSTDLGMKLPLKTPEDNNNTNGEDLSLDEPGQNVIREDEIPTCEMGDDEVFYKGTGTKEDPMEIN